MLILKALQRFWIYFHQLLHKTIWHGLLVAVVASHKLNVIDMHTRASERGSLGADERFFFSVFKDSFMLIGF